MIKDSRMNGFTLAELLITMTIIGVLAVVILTAVSNNQQNKDKVMTLKTYMRLSTIVSKIVNDEDNYTASDNDYNYEEFPLYNSNGTLCDLIAESFHIRKVARACSADNNIPDYSNELAPSFTTKDNMDFYIYTHKGNISEVKEHDKYPTDYKTVVYVDTDGRNSGNNCIFDKDTCTDPDVHKFLITADGKIYPIDGMSVFYSENPKNTKKDTYNNNQLANISNLSVSSNTENNYASVRLRPNLSRNNADVAELENKESLLASTDAAITVNSYKDEEDETEINYSSAPEDKTCAIIKNACGNTIETNNLDKLVTWVKTLAQPGVTIITNKNSDGKSISVQAKNTSTGNVSNCVTTCSVESGGVKDNDDEDDTKKLCTEIDKICTELNKYPPSYYYQDIESLITGLITSDYNVTNIVDSESQKSIVAAEYTCKQNHWGGYMNNFQVAGALVVIKKDIYIDDGKHITKCGCQYSCYYNGNCNYSL